MQPVSGGRKRWMSGWALLATAVVATGVAVCAQNPAEEETTRPAPRDGAWMELHQSFLERARQGKIDLLFLGDSITQGWYGRNGEGQGAIQVWDRYYAPRNAANFGIGGDRTQHVLWRLDHGEVDGITPRVVVLMIGTNNVRSNTPAEIADGVTAVVNKLKEKLPETRILLLGVFPRGKTPDSARERLKAVNARIARLDDGKTVTYLDIGPRFVNDDGTIPQDVMPDYLHLSRKGYRIWADAIEPTLWKMLEKK